jgi:hypothetical protein
MPGVLCSKRYERVVPAKSWRTEVPPQNTCGGESGCQNDGVMSCVFAVPGTCTGSVPPVMNRLFGFAQFEVSTLLVVPRLLYKPYRL